jgi:DNA topoisomerase-1
MAEAKVERTEAIISLSKRSEKLLAKGEVLKFDGFMKVYGGIKDDTLLPPVKEGDKLALNSMRATETFSRPGARYSEASLVRKLEELGIGRPSTYAPTISTIQTRGYIEKTDLEGTEREIKQLVLENSKIQSLTSTVQVGADRAKLVPTSIAEVTTDFLVKYFPSIVDYDFTATVEGDFDRIADGKEDWSKMLQKFYKDFHPLVAKSETASRQEVSQARELGKDPKSGKPIFGRFGRYGPMLQLGDSENEDEKVQFAPLPEGIRLENITLEQALPMFELPRTVGKTTTGDEITANIGRFGPYIKVDKTFVSIKPLDPHTITEAEARKLYTAKLKKDADKYIKEFNNGVKIVNGPYGPYVTDGKKNAKIPKDTDPASLTEEQCKKMIAEAPAKKRFTRRRKAS